MQQLGFTVHLDIMHPVENAQHFYGSEVPLVYKCKQVFTQVTSVWDGASDSDVHAMQGPGRTLLSLSARLLLQWDIPRERVSTRICHNMNGFLDVSLHMSTPAIVRNVAHEAALVPILHT